MTIERKLTVCGLNKKLLNLDFINLIKSYELLVFTESKLGAFDELEIPSDYSYFSKIRKKCKRKSGGITIVYKKIIVKISNLFEIRYSEFIQWIVI